MLRGMKNKRRCLLLITTFMAVWLFLPHHSLKSKYVIETNVSINSLPGKLISKPDSKIPASGKTTARNESHSGKFKRAILRPGRGVTCRVNLRKF